MTAIAENAPRERLPYRHGAIGIIVDSEGKILIVQMVTYPSNGWRFPGGGVENGETPVQALLRLISLGLSERANIAMCMIFQVLKLYEGLGRQREGVV